jgi:hypothetical protein
VPVAHATLASTCEATVIEAVQSSPPCRESGLPGTLRCCISAARPSDQVGSVWLPRRTQRLLARKTLRTDCHSQHRLQSGSSRRSNSSCRSFRSGRTAPNSYLRPRCTDSIKKTRRREPAGALPVEGNQRRVGVLVGAFRFLLLRSRKTAYLISVHPGQLAAAVGQPGRGKQQEQFLQVEPFDRVIDRQLSAAIRDIFHHAVAAPGAIDGHHLRSMAPIKYDPMVFSLLCHRCFAATSDGNTRRHALRRGFSRNPRGGFGVPFRDWADSNGCR